MEKAYVGRKITCKHLYFLKNRLPCKKINILSIFYKENMGEGEGARNIDVRAEQNINQLPLACSPDRGTNLQPIELATFRCTGALPTN